MMRKQVNPVRDKMVKFFKSLKEGERIIIKLGEWDIRLEDGQWVSAKDLGVHEYYECDERSIAFCLDNVISPFIELFAGLRLEYAGAEDTDGNPMNEFVDSYRGIGEDRLPDSFGQFIFVAKKVSE